MSPLFSPSGLIYRYVVQSPDRSAQELKVFQDWVLERRYRAIQGVADDSGLGGETMQDQVQIDPRSGFATASRCRRWCSNVQQQRQRRRRLYSQGGQFYYVRGLGQVALTEDIGNIVVAAQRWIPVSVHDRSGRDRLGAPARTIRLHAAERSR